MVNTPKSIAAHTVIDALDEQTKDDAQKLIEIMQRISGHEPVVWNVATLGFDTYHYKYESGREGDCHVLGFYPRKGKITLYLMDGTDKYDSLLSRLGKYSASKSCLYIKRLSDIDVGILEKILQESYASTKLQDVRTSETK